MKFSWLSLKSKNKDIQAILFQFLTFSCYFRIAVQFVILLRLLCSSNLVPRGFKSNENRVIKSSSRVPQILTNR